MTYPLTIDYSQSIKSLIKRGDYAWASKNINETNFPSSENGEVKIGVELISFGEDKSSENALKEIKKMGLEPLTLRELLHFGIYYPDFQRENPIVALGSTWRDPCGDVYAPCLNRDGLDRFLHLTWVEGDWLPAWRFAAQKSLRPLDAFRTKDIPSSLTKRVSKLEKQMEELLKVVNIK